MNNLWNFVFGFAYVAISIPFWISKKPLNLNVKKEKSFFVKVDLAIFVLLEVWAYLKYVGIDNELLLLTDALLLTLPIWSCYEFFRGRKISEVFSVDVN
ncbi:hypothetical protein [Aquitalea pelogenes]|uniref:hypothetical protein n=1 Tax=Aquitalea pelogenes TaxID=1293573 RepID=UPI0035B4D7ED